MNQSEIAGYIYAGRAELGCNDRVSHPIELLKLPVNQQCDALIKVIKMNHEKLEAWEGDQNLVDQSVVTTIEGLYKIIKQQEKALMQTLKKAHPSTDE
ncbi:hypothetical protein [Parvicella tangerina]|uniref:Uncharacterized protein n=1 Tax=Parvicella tangerina TaxID=2829795 RepID=A0A916JMA8_9FLAO|nr:hypothetical protein [Parvicella tangerina]CAG5081316.1 hypothetical protein CRYO30217_01592 [Parvicella tangerina]